MACGVGATSAARSVEDSSAHREGRGQARGEAVAMGLCGPAPKHPRTERRSKAPQDTKSRTRASQNWSP